MYPDLTLRGNALTLFSICLHRNLKASRVGEENEDRGNSSGL
jgi:hypothetical protein